VDIFSFNCGRDRCRKRLVRVTAVLMIVGVSTPASAFEPFFRWPITASGPTGTQGEPATLTWSLARDGLSIGDEGPSNLIDLLDDLFNVTSGGTNFQTRPWYDLVEQSFDRWSQVSGLSFSYEPSDSGIFAGDLGTLGVRGDIRIGGQDIDGPGGVLSYAYSPINGDIVVDTSETNRFSNSANNYRPLRNTLMHEIGHALGFDHVKSSDAALLMEPSINNTFDGPQLDDIRGVHAYYGDAFERSNSGQGNNAAPLATDLGTILAGGSRTVGSDAAGNQSVAAEETDFVSIANSDDVDYFSFVVVQPSILSATLTPLGGTLNVGPQGGTQTLVNAAALNNLALTVFAPNGTTVLASADNGTIGQVDSLTGVSLSTAGEYFVRVAGSSDDVQLYELQFEVIAAGMPIAGDFNHDGIVDDADYVVWRKGLGTNYTQADFNLWRANFGATLGGGSSLTATLPLSPGVPEPASIVLAILGAAACAWRVRSGRYLLLADDGYDDLSSPRFDVALEMKNLLPGAQHRFATCDRHADRRAEPRGLQVRMPVAVVPGLLVAILATGRD
jgi:hypothetical protein